MARPSIIEPWFRFMFFVVAQQQNPCQFVFGPTSPYGLSRETTESSGERLVVMEGADQYVGAGEAANV